MTEDFDVIVVGGGPGGSTAATLVAKQKHRVLLLEREKFPRYQIGESLLPATVHGICALLGVKDALRRANFTRKLGGTFRWGASPEPWTFNFGSMSGLSRDLSYAYQVERSKFDQILLDNARDCGVDVREEHAVDDVVLENGRVAGVRFKDAHGTTRSARARFVVDASGNRGLLGQHVGERVYSKFFQNLALFGYYENARRLDFPRTGNIFCAAFRDGWFWFIPLSPTLTSVGAVVARDKAALLEGGYESAMQSFIDACPPIKDLLAPARRVTEGTYGQLRVRKDYSYAHSRFWAPGVVLVGDAACFIDPVFSSGVHLSTYSALLAARSINTCLAGQGDEPRCFEEFERRYRREYSNFYQFLVSFYDMNRDLDSYYWEARNVLGTEEVANEAFIRLVAGLSPTGEQLETSAADFLGTIRGTGSVATEAGTGASSFQTERTPDGELMREVVQLQLQARGDGGEEKPLFAGGLVPSPDGLRWQDPSA